MDFSIWKVLDKAATYKSHKTIDSLKKNLKKAWEEIPLSLSRAADDQAIKSFSNVCEEFEGISKNDFGNYFLYQFRETY